MERNEFKERILVAESAIENAKEALMSGNDRFSVVVCHAKRKKWETTG